MALDSLRCIASSGLCSYHKSNKSTAQQKQSHWVSFNAEVDAHLAQAILIRPPLSVFEPMHRLVFSAPRTLAPSLCVAACELVGGRRQQAIAAASALHLVHAAAFAHLNLPSSESPNIDLLTGDGIFPFGYELLARSDQDSSNSDKILQVVVEIARASGAQGVMSESCCDDQKKDDGGRLCGCGAACGAILGGGSEEEIERMRRFGRYVGMVNGMMKVMDILGDYDDDGTKEKKSKYLMVLEEVERLRCLGLKELEGFSGRDVQTLTALMEESLPLQ